MLLTLSALTLSILALDVGSGSGYLTVCMAEMVGAEGRAVGVEHIPELVELAKKNTQKDHPQFLQDGRVAFHAADGRVGFPQHAPYDCMYVATSLLLLLWRRLNIVNYPASVTYWPISLLWWQNSHVGAAANELHDKLVEQLKAPGRMFIPVGDQDGQAIYVVDKDKNGKVTKKKTMNVWVKP